MKWQGKNRAVTFSFDDGVVQDRRTVALLNKYGLKGTFNLNSGYFGLVRTASDGVCRDNVKASEVKSLYEGHEVAVHTLTHPNLTLLDEETITRQVEEDRKALEALCGYPVIGMAYPCGGVNNDSRVAQVIGANTPIRYSRTITSTHAFDKQSDLLRFNPSVHLSEPELISVIERFLASDTQEEQLLYLWGHSYEMDMADRLSWEELEEVCKMLSGRENIFYCTNREALL